MTSSRIWLLPVDHEFQAVGNRFRVEASIDDEVRDLKDTLKEETPGTFSRYHIEPDCLTVWKTEGKLVIDTSTAKEDLKEILKKIDVNDEGTIRMLDPHVKVADLQLSDDQILLVRFPDGLPKLIRNVWFLLVDHKFQAVGNCFSVETSLIDDDVCELKDKITAEKLEIFSHYHIYPDYLTLWQTKGKLLINNSSSAECLEEILKNIDADDEDTIWKPGEYDAVADLQLSDDQVLLVQLPDDLPRLIRKVWLLLVDHNFQALGQSFPVDISFGDDVCDLKKKVNEEKPEILSHYRVDPSCLSVWKTEGELVIINPTAKRLEEILEKINIDDEDTIRRLGTQVKVADLDLSYGQTLLVRVPDGLPKLIRKVWLLLVDHNFHAHEDMFQVKTAIDNVVGDLKKKVKEEIPETFSQYHISPNSLTVWKTEGELVIINPTAKRLEETLEKIDVNDEGTIRKLDPHVKVADLKLSGGQSQTLLVRLPDSLSMPVRKEELAHAKAIEMAIHAPTPSSVSRDPELLNVEQAERPIYNWRPFGRRGPPITIYHEAFAKLKSALRDLTKVADGAEEKRLQNTAKLYLEATDIHDTEEERRNAVIPLLNRLLDIDLIEKRTVKIGDMMFTPDAIAEEAIDGAETKAVIAFVQFKNEFGGDCGVQTALGLRKYLARDEYEAIRNASCCPCITVSVAGPYLSIGGAILVDAFTVEPFTEYIFLGGDPYTEERTLHHARIFAAVSQALLDLKQFYRKLKPNVTPALYRLFPNPSYIAGKTPQRLDFTSRFDYKGRRSDDYQRSLFRATYGDREPEEVLVKFCERYHGDGHRLVAAANCAPKLFFCEQILGGVTMVIMKFIDGLDSHYRFAHEVIPPNILDDVSNAVKVLHNAGLVFGDLRRPNIIIYRTGDSERAMLIDFDWVGLDGQARYPGTLNDTGIIK